MLPHPENTHFALASGFTPKHFYWYPPVSLLTLWIKLPSLNGV